MGATDLSLASWRKSSFSGGNSGCVEVGHAAALVGIRDSKHVAAGHLAVPRARWTAFLASIR